MPRVPLHERVRRRLPEAVRSRLPERFMPPAWRKNAPQMVAPDWSLAAPGGEVRWSLGDPAVVWASDGATAVVDNKAKPLEPPVFMPFGTVGTVVAIGSDFLVVEFPGQDRGVRVNKIDLAPQLSKDERAKRWGRRRGIIEVTAHDVTAHEVTAHGL